MQCNKSYISNKSLTIAVDRLNRLIKGVIFVYYAKKINHIKKY